MLSTQQYDKALHRLIRINEVQEICGVSRSTIYGKLNEKSPQYDPDFPKPIHTGARMVAWLEAEVQSYIEFCIDSSRKNTCQIIYASQAMRNAAMKGGAV